MSAFTASMLCLIVAGLGWIIHFCTRSIVAWLQTIAKALLSIASSMATMQAENSTVLGDVRRHLADQRDGRRG